MTKRRNLDLSNAGSFFDSTGKLNLIAGTNVSISSTDSSFTISATDTNTTYTNVSEFTNDANYLDSTTVQGVINASYIQANQITYNTSDFLDSTTVELVVDASYVQARQTTYNTSNFTDSAFVTGLPVSTFTNDANYLDSATVTGVINPSYIQANQTTYNTSDFVDSAYVTTQINNLIGSAPGTLDTLGEIANALNNDSNAYGSLVALINGMADSAWVQSLPVSTFTNDANYLDSTTVTGVINSSYIQSNQITYNTADFLDSTTVSLVVDAAYVQARQTTYNTSNFTDSAFVTGLPVSTFTNDANYLDSTTVQGVVNSSYIQSNQITYNTSDFLDSTTVSLVVDAAYVQARQTTYNTSNFVDSAYVTTQINNLIGSAPGTLDTLEEIANALNNDSNAYGSLVALINGMADSDWVQSLPVSTFTNDANYLDSTTVQGVVNAAYVQARQTTYNTSDFLDSTTVSLVVDASYVQARQTTYSTADFLDSVYAIALIDSAYIEARRPAETIFGVVNNGSSAYTFSGDGFPSTVDNPTLYLARGKTYKFGVNASSHPFQIRLSSGGSAYSDGVTNNGAQVGDVIFTVPMNAPNSLVYQCTVHSGMVGNIVIFDENSFLDSTSVTGVINASYIQANQITYNTSDFTDSAFVTGLPVSTFTNDANYLDSTTVQGVVNAAYIQNNQITYNTSDFVDSITVTGVIDAHLNQSNPTSGYVLSWNGSDYAWVAQTGGGGGSGTLDSSTVLSVIDGHLNQSNPTSGYVLSWNGSDYAWVAQSGGLDSALVIDLIDSAYIQARQTTGGGTTTVGTLGVTTYTYEADSGSTVFTGADVNGATLTFASSGLIQVFRNGVLLSTDDYTASSNTVTLTFGADSADVISISAFGGYQQISGNLGISTTDSSAVFGQTVFARTYTPGKIMVFRNGVLLKDSDDYTAINGTSITLASAADSNDYISISEFIGDNGVDSATAISLASALPISTFTNDANYLDSTTVQGVINASYIQANQTTYNTSDFLDSTTVTGVINASYIQSNQTTYSTADFLDSVYTLALLANNDITIGAVIETYSAIGASDIDLSTANYFSKTISGTTTFTVSNVASSGNVSSFILELTNGGSATVNWFSGVTWASATAPTLTTSGLDILGFFTRDGGTTWRGLVLAQAVA